MATMTKSQLQRRVDALENELRAIKTAGRWLYCGKIYVAVPFTREEERAIADDVRDSFSNQFSGVFDENVYGFAELFDSPIPGVEVVLVNYDADTEAGTCINNFWRLVEVPADC